MSGRGKFCRLHILVNRAAVNGWSSAVDRVYGGEYCTAEKLYLFGHITIIAKAAVATVKRVG